MDELLALGISYLVLIALLCFAGIALNAVMLLVLHVHLEIRTPQRILLINLCISDLVYLLGGTLMIVAVSVIHDKIVCFVTVFFVSFVMAVDAYSSAALCLQRYISLRKFGNTYHLDEKKRKYSLLIALGVWVLAAVLAAVEYLILRPDEGECAYDLLVGIPLYRLGLYATVPSVMIIGLDIASYRLLAAQDAPNGAVDREQEGRRIHVKLILLFFFTYPTTIVFLYLATISGMTCIFMIVSVGCILTTLNSFFHPILMCIASKKIRVLFKDYWCCRRCCQQPDTSDTADTRALVQRGEAISQTAL